jgi:hypothetical protein
VAPDLIPLFVYPNRMNLLIGISLILIAKFLTKPDLALRWPLNDRRK